MRMLNMFKKITLAALTVTLLATGMTSEAKTVSEPKETSKQTVEVGSSDWVTGTNLKINGKSYSKSKKKVKTIITDTTVREYRSYKGTIREYIDDNVVYDEETIKKQKLNYNYIDINEYRLDFLKPGVYKITYDTYSYDPTTNTENANDYVYYDDLGCYALRTVSEDLTYYTYTPVIFKTTVTETYKVVYTKEAIKNIKLGKTSVTNTITRSGSQYKEKVVIKNRYLKGNSGKVQYKANSNYQITSGYAITRGADGYLTIAPANNKNNVSYSKVSTSNTYEYDKVVTENGVDKKDADGNKVRTTTTTGTSKAKYKTTQINYGYKDKFIGNYTKYEVSDRTVYIPTRPEKGDDEVEYQKDAAGNYVTDAEGKQIPIVTAVTAKVLTTTTTSYGWFDGKYQMYATVKERVISPKAKTSISDAGDYKSDYYDYWVDAKGSIKKNFGSNETISVGGVACEITLADGSVRTNPAYNRAKYSNSYVGTWVDKNSVTDADEYSSVDSSYSDVDSNGNITTEYVFKYTLDAKGNRINRVNNNSITLGSTSGGYVFRAK